MLTEINIDNAIFTETANMPLTSNADRPYPTFFLKNSVYHLNDVILLMLFFITSNHFPFKKKHRRASNTTDVVFSERVDKMHVLPSKYPYVTPF